MEVPTRYTHQGIALLDAELAAQEEDDRLELVAGRDFEHIVLHDGRRADRLEPDDDCGAKRSESERVESEYDGIAEREKGRA